VRAWWKEYAESREGPSQARMQNAESHSQIERDYESSRSQLKAWEEEENVGVLVKGGLYEVKLLICPAFHLSLVSKYK
jgi:hypothetical protein